MIGNSAGSNRLILALGSLKSQSLARPGASQGQVCLNEILIQESRLPVLKIS